MALQDGVYCRHLTPPSLPSVQTCRSTSRLALMTCPVIKRGVSGAGPMVSHVPPVRLRISSSAALMTVHMPEMTMATDCVQGMCTRGRSSGRCSVVGCDRIGALFQSNCRSTWGSSRSFTMCASEAKHCWARSLHHSLQKTLEPKKSLRHILVMATVWLKAAPSAVRESRACRVHKPGRDTRSAPGEPSGCRGAAVGADGRTRTRDGSRS